MKRASSKFSTRSLIALVMVVVSFLMLLFPWIHISAEVMGREYSLPDFVDLVCRYEGVSSDQLRLEMQKGISDFASEFAEDTGIFINPRRTASTIEKILDGNISLWDATTICTYGSGVLRDVQKASNQVFLELFDFAAMMKLKDTYQALTISAIVLWAIMAALIVTFGTAVFTLLSNGKRGVVAYTIMVVMTFIAFSVLSVKANNLLPDFLDEFIVGVQGIGFCHLSFAPFACLICSIAAVLVTRLHKAEGKIRMPNIGSMENLTNWTCSCGSRNKAGNRFCSSCGQKRPEKPQCACGATIIPGTRFCAKCGSPVKSAPESGAVHYSFRKCSHCGAEIAAGVQYCQECGMPVECNNL